MSDLRVVETYVSYQGEGPNTSRPTVFVRFAGCNFKCPGWPCDTQHAIDPKIYRKLQTVWAPDELAQCIISLDVENICLTGGEVFLQSADGLLTFTKLLGEAGCNVEVFTNGSLLWRDDVAQWIDTFILDWKLPGSGEEYDPTTAFETNFNRLRNHDAIKFTIKNRVDYEEAKRRYKAYVTQLSPQPRVYAGVVWGALETEELCNWMMQDNLDWNLNVQVHKFIWHPDKIGV